MDIDLAETGRYDVEDPHTPNHVPLEKTFGLKNTKLKGKQFEGEEAARRLGGEHHCFLSFF